jgi:hypothetical protein
MMLMRFHAAEISGSMAIDGYVDLNEHSPILGAGGVHQERGGFHEEEIS